MYETSCDEIFEFLADGIEENKFVYCPYCGKPIVEIPYEEEKDEG